MTRRCPWKKARPAATLPPPSSFARGEHKFHIVGYSTAGDAHDSILSGTFQVGGHTWALDCGFDEDGHIASVFLQLLTPYITADSVVLKAGLRIEDPVGRCPAIEWQSEGAHTFTVWSDGSWQELDVVAARRHEEDTGTCIADDIRKLLFLSSEPKSKKSERRVCMLPDVTFVVEQTEIEAHRVVLAMRSPVFAAELLGHMRESTTRRVRVDDMRASTFRAMIRFIYTDELPIKTITNNSESRSQRPCKEKCAARRRIAMACDLLVAADRYDLEKLRLICENILSENMDIASVMPTLMAVDGRHSCCQLEASCIAYLASDADVYAAVKATEEYKELEESCNPFIVEVKNKCDIVVTNKAGSVRELTRAWPTNIDQQLKELLASETGAYVTFLVEKREIRAHKLVIATRSPVLYKMVRVANKQDHGVVRVDGVKAVVFEAVLHFIYTRELPPMRDIALATEDGVMIVGDMMAAACRFGLDGMKAKCETLLAESISKENAVLPELLLLIARSQTKPM
ncbi:unnamed protein product [Alopecurus aequalis]